MSHEYTGSETLADEQTDFPDVAIYVFNESGDLIDANGGHAPKPETRFEKNDNELRLGLRRNHHLFVGVTSWRETDVGIHQFGMLLALLWLPLTALTALSAWIAGGLALRPVGELISSAERISSSSDELELSTSDTAEYADLAKSLNRLISRVRYAAHLQEQFAADAAHELRSPLAILRTRIEANLMRDRSVEEHIASQQKMLGQVDRLTSIVEALLRSARHEHGAAEATDVFDTGRRICAQWDEEHGNTAVPVRISGARAVAAITLEELTVVLLNLLENARRFTPNGTAIEVDIRPVDDKVRLTVRDYGPGIPAEHRSKVFERFYRSDSSRNTESGGAGIGLAIVKRIAEMRGGSVLLNEVNAGTSISVLLPASSKA